MMVGKNTLRDSGLGAPSTVRVGWSGGQIPIKQGNRMKMCTGRWEASPQPPVQYFLDRIFL